MQCALCQSGNHADFPVEMMIHFSGKNNFGKPGILAFPKVSVCLDCGFTGFTIPEDRLRVLQNSVAASAAAA